MDRVQCVKLEQLFSQSLRISKGVPQGSILGLTLFSIYINYIACSAGDSSIHFYADDTILHTSGPSPDAVPTSIQDSFLKVQQAFSSLNLLLNTTRLRSCGSVGKVLGHKSKIGSLLHCHSVCQFFLVFLFLLCLSCEFVSV